MSEILFDDSAHNSDAEDLQKALLAPGSAGELYSTAGGSLTNQSLEGMLSSLTLKQSDFTIWQDISKTKGSSTVLEYAQETGLGISDAGSFVQQMGNPEFRDPDFVKGIAQVKFMSEGWQASHVAMATDTIIDEKTKMQRSAMSRLLRSVNTSLFTGDSSLNPMSFDGVAKTISSEGGTDQVRDMRGGNLTIGTLDIAGQIIFDANGEVDNSKVYMSAGGVNNLSKLLQNGAGTNRNIIESGEKGITLGGEVNNIRTSFGIMQKRVDKTLGMAYENKRVPQYKNSAGALVEGATSDNAPSMPAITLTNQSSVSGSYFTPGVVRPSGVKYGYRVVSKNSNGSSIACAEVVSTSAVADGGAVSISIQPFVGDSASKLPSYYEIYSTKVGESGTYRYMTSVAANATNALSPVAYVDKNDYIPETARMFVVDQTTSGEARVMNFHQLMPIHNVDLAKMGNYDQGLINLWGTPMFYKPNSLVEIRNIGVDQTAPNIYNVI